MEGTLQIVNFHVFTKQMGAPIKTFNFTPTQLIFKTSRMKPSEYMQSKAVEGLLRYNIMKWLISS